MKKTLLLVIATLAIGTLYAQNEIAILKHNDNLSAFYGTSALIEAMDSAVAGDVITLSSGSFGCSRVKKGVTVRGNGFEEDLVAGGVMPTKVILQTSSWSSYIPFSDSSIVEGIKFMSPVSLQGTKDVQISKCYLGIDMSMSLRVVIVGCYITDGNTSSSTDAIISNSIAYLRHGATALQVMNSIITCEYNYLYNGNYGTFTNCIVMDNTSNNTQTACYNCIGINLGSSTNGFFANAINHLEFQNMTQAQQDSVMAAADVSHGNYNASSLDEVFQTYRGGDYATRQNYSLTTAFDTLISNLGVYNGMMPYTPFVNRPRYVRTNASPRTTLDGKLSVDIQVVTAEE